MKIFIDASVFQNPSTGVAKSVAYLYESCFDLMPALEVSALHLHPLSCSLPQNIQTIQCGKYIPGRFWRNFSMPMYVSQHKPDIVHFPLNGNVPKFLFNTKVVTTIHDVLPLSLPDYFKSDKDEQSYRKKVQNDIDRTHLLITVSEYSKKQILNNFDVTVEPVVIYNGPTIKVKSRLIEINDDKENDYFLYTGNYDPRKGIESLLTVFISLHRKKLLSSKLVLTGDKNYYSEELRKLIHEGHILGIIEEKGYVSDEVLSGLYSKAKALIYPSKYEGFGLPPLEAMVLGCPVITTKYMSLPEVCGDAAYYIDPDNENDFAEGLLAIENDPELRNELKIKGKKQASKFSWHLSAKKYLDEVAKIDFNS